MYQPFPPAETLICCNSHHFVTAKRELTLWRKRPAQFLDIYSVGSGLLDDLLWWDRWLPRHTICATTYCRQAQTTPRSKILPLASQTPAIRIHITSMTVTNSLPLLVIQASFQLWSPSLSFGYVSSDYLLLAFYVLYDFPSCFQKQHIILTNMLGTRLWFFTCHDCKARSTAIQTCHNYLWS